MSEPHPGVQRVGVTALAAYRDRIDVRSPAEFGLDHVPAAANHPVLDDAERANIGTLYAASPFLARKRGAALVARSIATMLETAFIDHGREWRPLVYCWRGGQRSRALTHVLNAVGWRAVQLEGGYRAYRRHVVTELVRLPLRCRFVVICGLTGSGKSRLLAALARSGAQTPRRHRPPPRLAAGRPARRPATVAEVVRKPALRRARASRSIATSVRRSGKPTHR
jgi:tRNA 2-selenouridine synthase